VGVGGNVADLLGLDPFTLLGNGSGTVVGTLSDDAHILHFGRVNDGIVHFSVSPFIKFD
jgi:hypothetical protein